MKIVWAVGVTTVKERVHTTLQPTLNCLRAAGFPIPRLFADNSADDFAGPVLNGCYLNSPLTNREPRIRAYGNWLLGLTELVIREPLAHYYAMFQDDLLCYKNLRPYLESCVYPSRGYWNLYTFPENQQLVPPDPKNPAQAATGWFRSNQRGRGGLGLVFSQDVAYKLLGSQHMYSRMRNLERGWQSIDGAVVTALAHQGVVEFIHSPSLTQHTGSVSIMGKDSQSHPHYLAHPEWKRHTDPQPVAPLFRGADFDAMELIKERITK